MVRTCEHQFKTGRRPARRYKYETKHQKAHILIFVVPSIVQLWKGEATAVGCMRLPYDTGGTHISVLVSTPE